ncbi:Gfo/Idh/MocA family protein [Paenibacillus lutimineralis]|uniref:Gfo/Idh/MocA family oxidoreductase n=1 Tax=Paenibacillus lutimineralis TaxID=2707005 RepID=A0A3Q9IB85_9BACL|nr:Gfo/Idh/MocA family oxidoreductase [Paenibacillus lutimineralis]AZS16794.1 gfo/Idh/MocA family oxidoreductase [Paenibacillus lutimineralis]
MEHLNIGIIGTDSSHSVAFTRLLNDPSDVNHVPGGKVVAAFLGGSEDFALSADRVQGFMATLETEFGVRRMDSPEEIAASCDAILLTSADGRVHLEQFKRIAPYGKPVFVDKPLALCSQEAEEIFRIAQEHQVPLMSSSTLRYAQQITEDLALYGTASVISTDVGGPLDVEPTQSYYYWYGIHSVELLYGIMGSDCVEVNVTRAEEVEHISAVWRDGRVGTIRLSRHPGTPFSAEIHRQGQISSIEIDFAAKPFYASLLEQIMILFQTRIPPLRWQETLEVIRFVEAAEESRKSGNPVRL